jgi:hypothetical protein
MIIHISKSTLGKWKSRGERSRNGVRNRGIKTNKMGGPRVDDHMHCEPRFTSNISRTTGGLGTLCTLQGSSPLHNDSADEQRLDKHQKDTFFFHSPEYMVALECDKATIRASLVQKLEPCLPFHVFDSSPSAKTGLCVPPSLPAHKYPPLSYLVCELLI